MILKHPHDLLIRYSWLNIEASEKNLCQSV